MTRRPGATVVVSVVVAVVILGAGPPLAADVLTPDEVKWVRACLDQLGANAPRLRASAETALVHMGRSALPAIVTHAKRLKGSTAHAALTRVLVAMGRGPVLQALGRMADEARSGEKKRILAIMERLGSAVGVGEPLTIDLSPRDVTRWQEVPPDVEHALANGWPQRLLPGGGTVGVDAKGLTFHPTGASPVVLAPGTAQVVSVPVPQRRLPARVLLYDKLGRWYAASAHGREGKAGALHVQCWDADLDGRFTGDGDQVRAKPAAWQRLGPHRLVAHGHHVYTVAPTDDGTQVTLTAVEPPPFLNATHASFFRALHAWRAAHGLGPLRYDVARSKACAAHSAYLTRNRGNAKALEGGASHYQDPALPGATPEGAEAGAASVLYSGGLSGTLHAIAGTMLHRIAWLAPTNTLIGMGASRSGAAAWSTVWTHRGGAETDPRLVTVPAPGAEDVPGRGIAEWPPPDEPANWYRGKRGYPVSATYSHLGYTQVRLKVLRAFGEGEVPVAVPGRFWSPEAPIAASHASNRGTAFFMPVQPLERDVAYWAVFEAQGPAGPILYAWTFRSP